MILGLSCNETMSNAVGLGLFLCSVAGCVARSKKSTWLGSGGGIKIEELWLYPIKGCKGFQVEAAKMTARGLEHDRTFMIVKESNGRFVSQRGLPKMALLETRLSKDRKVLIVSAKRVRKDIEDLRIHLDGLNDQNDKEFNRQVTVWGQECLAHDCGDEYAKWFNTVLGGDETLRLVHMLGAKEYDRTASEGGIVSFADQYPVLLASQESIAGLNARLESPVQMERFRPNVVVRGVGTAFAEDTWEAVSFLSPESTDKLSMDVPFPPCGRCKVPTNDLDTGVLDSGNEPTKTMMTFRSGSHLGFSARKLCAEVYFGVHLARPATEGGKSELRRGDRVVVHGESSLASREVLASKRFS